MKRKTTEVRRVRAGLDRIGGAVEGRPALADRTAALLRGDLRCPDLEAAPMGKMLHVPLRLPEKLVGRADALVPLLESDPRMEAVGRVVRATVLRLALSIGLAQLERDTAAAAKGSGRRRG